MKRVSTSVCEAASHSVPDPHIAEAREAPERDRPEDHLRPRDIFQPAAPAHHLPRRLQGSNSIESGHF